MYHILQERNANWPSEDNTMFHGGMMYVIHTAQVRALSAAIHNFPGKVAVRHI